MSKKSVLTPKWVWLGRIRIVSEADGQIRETIPIGGEWFKNGEEPEVYALIPETSDEMWSLPDNQPFSANDEKPNWIP